MLGLQNLKRQRSIDCYMNKTFVKTQNVRNFIGLIENLHNKPQNQPANSPKILLNKLKKSFLGGIDIKFFILW